MFSALNAISAINPPRFETRKALVIINLQNDSLYQKDDIYICKNRDFVDRIKSLVPYFRKHGDIIWVRTEFTQNSPRTAASSPTPSLTEEEIAKKEKQNREEQEAHERRLEDDTAKTGSRENSVRSSTDEKPQKKEDAPQVYHPSSSAKSMMMRASAQARADRRSANMTVFDDSTNVWEDKLAKPRKGEQPKFYVGGTHGAEILDELKPIVDDSVDMTLTKQFYSAFDQTDLLMSLRMRLCTEIYICGCLTNVGVYATAADAVQHGYDVSIVEDCLGYRSEDKHEEAMRQMADIMGANGIDSEEIIEEAGGRAPPDTDDLLFSGPGPDGINLGDLSLAAAVQSRVGTTLEGQSNLDAEPRKQQTNKQAKAKISADIRNRQQSPVPTNVEGNIASSMAHVADNAAIKRAASPVDELTPLPSPGISSLKSRESLTVASAHTLGPKDSIGAGDSRILYDVLSSPLADDAFSLLKEEIDWQTMHHRGGAVPRLVAVQGQIETDGGIPIYRHPADESPPLLEFSPTLDKIRNEVEKAVQQPLNHALIQMYRDGIDNISEHSDKTLDIVRDSNIINVSLGAQRVMTLRTKKSQRAQGAESPVVRQTQRVPMPHNSAFVLGPRSNSHWLHGVRADKRPAQLKSDEERSYGGERISITFRHIGTFMNEKQRKIWGQGARNKTRATAGTIPRGNTAEVEAMVVAFGKENHQPDFDWDAEYGQGFDVVNLVNDKPKLSLCQNEVANLRVQLYLAEKAIPYTIIQQEESASPKPPRTRFQPWTHGLSNTQNPVFEDINEDAARTEGDVAILFYLNSFYPFSTPQGASKRQVHRASVLVYTRTTQSNELLFLWWELQAASPLRGRSPEMRSAPQRPSSADTDSSGTTPLSEFTDAMKMWEGYAAESLYIASDFWTIIDCAFWPVLYEISNGWGDFEQGRYPCLYAYHERVMERECVKQLLNESVN